MDDRLLFGYARFYSTVGFDVAALGPSSATDVRSRSCPAWSADSKKLSEELMAWMQLANHASHASSVVGMINPCVLPEQANTSDCGVFVIATVEAIVSAASGQARSRSNLKVCTAEYSRIQVDIMV